MRINSAILAQEIKMHSFILLITCILFSITSPLLGGLETLPVHCQIQIDEVIQNYFKGIPQEKITISPIFGGYSNTSLLLTIGSAQYVLRIKDKDASLESLKRELYAMQEAAKIGVAPEVLYSTKDSRAFLMEYIKKPTATITETKDPKNIIKIADALLKAHAIPKNPYFEENLNETAQNVYLTICHIPEIKSELDSAIKLMWEFNEEIEKFEACKVNIHGELNPRNMFLEEDRALFIDWEYTSFEDPFYDLSYIAIFHAYSPKDELYLLNSYLKQPASDQELVRYYLSKKINLAQLCIFFHYFSQKCNLKEQKLDRNSPLKDWSCYMKSFSDRIDDSSMAQFFYDLARCCYNNAKR